MDAKSKGRPGPTGIRRRRWSPAARFARGGAVAASLGLAACQPAVLDPQGVVGIAEKTILIDSLAIMLAIVVPTVVATLGFAWWFRASNTRATHLPGWAYSGRIELIVWGIPLLVITLLGGVAWIGSHQLDPAKPLAASAPPVEIQGVSLDWRWLFIYPNERIATVNELVVPAGVPIHFALTSASVMNAFFIPQLGSMIYTMNGMTTQLNLQADTQGTYRGLSSHYSGDGFSDMHFQVRAVSAEQFAAWVAATRNAGPTLDAASYTELAKQSLDSKPFTFGAADPGLFQQIVMQHLPPGPGPQAGRPNRTVSPRTEE
jgi:cytochrome o ubiquinol oxidase subunit 2